MCDNVKFLIDIYRILLKVYCIPSCLHAPSPNYRNKKLMFSEGYKQGIVGTIEIAVNLPKGVSYLYQTGKELIPRGYKFKY